MCTCCVNFLRVLSSFQYGPWIGFVAICNDGVLRIILCAVFYRSMVVQWPPILFIYLSGSCLYMYLSNMLFTWFFTCTYQTCCLMLGHLLSWKGCPAQASVCCKDWQKRWVCSACFSMVSNKCGFQYFFIYSPMLVPLVFYMCLGSLFVARSSIAAVRLPLLSTFVMQRLARKRSVCFSCIVTIF